MNIAEIRLSAHLLQVSSPPKSPKEVVARMCAIQAQDYGMAKWAIGIRSPGCTEADVEEAFNRGEILRTHIMRPTWHFITREDIRWILPLCASRVASAGKYRDLELGLTENLYLKANEIVRKALDGGKHLTRDELAECLQREGLAANSAQMTHFMMRAEQDEIVCSGAMRGKQHTYALFDERVPRSTPLSRDEALAKLAERYFSSHAPASLQDFVWWSGLTTSEARQGLDAIKSKFVSEIVDSQTYFLPNDFKIDSSNESCHILPAFDEYIIAYRYRNAVLSSENHSKAVSSNGIFRPVILQNGKVSGLWKKKTSGKKISVATDFFEQTDELSEKLLDKAIESYCKFLNI